jgi:dihydroflavonol-4-reductase
MSDTVLVTGGTGYIARWCIAELLDRGYDVRTTVRDLSKDKAIRAAVGSLTDPEDRLGVVVADLTADLGWDAAVDGCGYVLHVASPLGAGPGNPDDLIIPARDGTLRVLGAAVRAGVDRVVMTSAANAASPTSYTEDGVTDETLWTDLDAPDLPAYRRSKTIAELAAWNHMAGLDTSTTLTTVLPGAVFGPILAPDNIGSVAVVARLLSGAMPGTPKIGLEVVDVRDLVDLHLRAMTDPAAGGERFLGTGDFLWMSEIADVLRDQLGPIAAKVPRRSLPNALVRLLARSRLELQGILPGLGRRNRHSTEKAERVLGWSRRPTVDTIVDCARSLVDHGVVGGEG